MGGGWVRIYKILVFLIFSNVSKTKRLSAILVIYKIIPHRPAHKIGLVYNFAKVNGFKVTEGLN